MKIDSHVHITPPDIIAGWKKYAEKEPYFSLISNNKYNKFATAEDAVAALERNCFDKAVVFGFGFCDMGLCGYVNDYVIDSVRRHPEKLIGFAVAPPCNEKAAYEIERCFNAGLRGVGELFPAGQGFDPENEKDTIAVTGICKELAIPLLLHVNEPVGHYYTGKTDVSLKQIETFVINNPGLDIILAHWGGGLLFYETMKEVKESFCNVYYDTAITPFLYDTHVFRIAQALNLCGKILFGTDFPVLPHSRCLALLEESGLPDKEKNLILGENARKLLKI